MTDNPVSKNRLLPPSPTNPRNSEGSMVQLTDGRTLFAYSHFYGGAADGSPAYIAVRDSTDAGRTWSTPDVTLVENEGKENVMSVSFLRLSSAEIALFYAVKNGWHDCKLYMRRSCDEGQTWSEPVCTIPQDGYYVVNNDRVVKLSSGRLLVPAAYHPIIREKWSHRGISMCFLSDDSGATWRPSTTTLHAPDNVSSGLQEPGVIELRDSRLMMLMRTTAGCQFRSYSEDRGVSWTDAMPTDIMSPCSPATLRRIPSTGDILMVWNDHSGERAKFEQKRTPLTTAISRDEGQTWDNVKVLDDDPDGWYCYTSALFVEDRVLLSYCAGNKDIGGLNLLQVTSVDVGWLYA